MANRRFEMYQYHKVLTRCAAGHAFVRTLDVRHR